MDANKLKKILDLHLLWLQGDLKGERADLSGADLSRANLSRANLSRANLSWANLSGANLSWANLSWANLSVANLSRADLSGANLSGANLNGANLSWADLSDANLSRANLSWADLSVANLSRANLSGAIGIALALAMASHIPSHGPIQGWKKCQNNVLVRLLIPANAKRSHGASRKCRASYVQVLEVVGAEQGISIHDSKTVYTKGATIKCDKWDEDRWNECSGGIHFFITREEAEAY